MPRRVGKRLIPHALTLLRVPLGVAFLLVSPLDYPRGQILQAAILALAAASDYLDGRLARSFGTVGAFGKWADPLTDAIFFLFVFLSFRAAGLMPLFLLILFVVRETAQHALVRPLSVRLGVELGARPAGKLKTGLQVVGTAGVIAMGAAHAGGAMPRGALVTASAVTLSVIVAVSLASLAFYVAPLIAAGRSRERGAGS